LQTPYDCLNRKPHLYSLRLKNKGIRVVYIPYGIELADTEAARHDHFREPVLRNAWRIYTLSEEFKREYEKYCENARAVRALGLPRFDSLQQKERFALASGLREKIDNRKIIVWHVHFAKTINESGGSKQVTPYLEEYIAFAEQLVVYRDSAFFIFLPHPKFGDDAIDEENNRKSMRVVELLMQTENVYVDTADDYRPSLLNADAIITDRSALMVESAIVNVPVLYLKNPDYDEPIFPPLTQLADSYYQGTNRDDMVRFVDLIAKGVDERRNKRLSAIEKCIPCLDGKCGERIKEDIYNSIMEQSCLPVRREEKNIIIFGTGFLFNKIMSFFQFPTNCHIIALSDNDAAKWGQVYNGIKIVSPNRIQGLHFDKIIIMVGNVFEEQVYKQLRFDLEIPESKIEYCEYISMLI
jgi:CDP-glycerol glycerophosphotransferase (TagB/SpsB family)